MAERHFKQAVGRVIFETGLTEEGKPIRKAKMYRNIAETASAASIYEALEALAQLSEHPFVEIEHISTATIDN